MSATPRTDAAILPEGPGGTYQYECVSSELARTLERELAESKEHAQYEASRADGAVAELVAVHSENAALRENLEILHDAMRCGGLTHTQGEGYAESPRCRIVSALLNPESAGGTENG